jgi:putative phosphonate metabolism protein
MANLPRYAIYFVPAADSPFYRFGSSLLRYDCYSGLDLEQPDEAGLPDDWAGLTEEPRRYGFHATLKAPFRLAHGRDEMELLHAFATFGQQPREIATIRPVVRALSKFTAIVPQDRSAALDQLAADCVTYFDAFRAPLTSIERTRRMTAGFSKQKQSNLERWGYPYVFDDFRFHMTLTGALAEDRAAPISRLLATLLRRCRGAETVSIDRIALLRQDHAAARFWVIREAPFPQ